MIKCNTCQKYFRNPTLQKCMLLTCFTFTLVQIILYKKNYSRWQWNILSNKEDPTTSLPFQKETSLHATFESDLDEKRNWNVSKVTQKYENLQNGPILNSTFLDDKRDSIVSRSTQKDENLKNGTTTLNATSREHLDDEWFVPRSRQRDEKGRIYILYWRHNWGLKTWGWKDNKDLGDCVITYSRSKIKDAEAVVFHFTGLDQDQMPWKFYRDPDQYFIFYHHESPPYMKLSEGRKTFSKFDNGFTNMTMTYRSDSTIYAPVRGDPPMEDILKEGKQWVDKIIARNKKNSLWVVSNCRLLYGSVQRMKYVQALVNSGLPVDRYGQCFSNSKEYQNMPNDQLLSYKFYLSFENAIHCTDYITEKFWKNAISNGRVPVVWGPSKENVTRLTPTNSFIHAEDFESPASLASYLLYLDKNDTAYREYFSWIENPDERTKAIVDEYAHSAKVKLCDILKAKRRKRIVIPSVTDFYLDEPATCFQPK